MSNFGDLHQVMANPRDTLAKFVPRKSAALDTIRINMYLGKIMEWAVTRFTWNKLPDTVDARYIESTLNTAGMCIFYYDARYGKHLCVAANPIGDYDVYGNSYKYQTESYGKYYGLTIDAEDCVPTNISRLRHTSFRYRTNSGYHREKHAQPQDCFMPARATANLR